VIIGFGTSLPELTVTIEAVLTDYPDIALGNIVGSNIANILLIVAIAAILSPVLIKGSKPTTDVAVMLLASFALYICKLFDALNAITGIIFLILLLLYVVLSYRSDVADHAEDTNIGSETNIKIILYCLGGLFLLIGGGHLLIDSAVTIARSFNISEAVIGLTVVAVGTSLPELTTAILASIKKQNDVIIGNIVGSNIFNILGILGLTIIIKPIPISPAMLHAGMIEMLVASIIFSLLLLFRPQIGRGMGASMLAGYIVYLYFLFNV
jgi:cation:H+ antiporter